MKKNYFIVFLLVATELIGFGLIIPILPQISHQYTNSGLLLGLLLSSYSLAQFIAAPILGQLSDKIGRKPVLLISKFGTILSYLMLANAASYSLLLISRLIDGFSGGNIAVARAYLTDITKKENRSKAMAVIGVAFGTGFIFGPALGGICYSVSNDFKIAGIVGALFSFISLVITLMLLKEPKKKEQSEKNSLLRNINQLSFSPLLLLILSLLGMMIFSGFETSFSIFTESKFNFNTKENSFLFFLIGITAFFIQGSFTRISFKSIKKAMFIAFLCIGLALVISSLGQSLWSSISPLILLIFGIAILNTHIPAELSNISDNKGFIMGVYESINSIARILGPLLFLSILYNQINNMYLILGIFALIISVLSQVIFLKYKTNKL